MCWLTGWSVQHVMECAPTMRTQAGKSKARMLQRLGGEAFPLDYATALSAIRGALAAVEPHPVVCSEGANTMDQAR